MKFISSLTVSLVIGCVSLAFAQTDPPRARLGINLAGPADWTSEIAFVDVFRVSREWISQRPGAGFGKGPELKIDDAGWITELEPGCYAETPMCSIKRGHYPSGKYTVLYKGEGKLAFWAAASLVEQSPGRAIIQVDASKGDPIWMQIRETNPANYIRDIRVILPGFEQTFETEPFNPDFLKMWKGIACFRFMDWTLTNGSKVSTWASRPKPTDATWSIKGIPVEVMVDLCNRQKVDAWFCMPHLADDDYIQHFAAYVKANLDPSLKAYIEYSNEAWNSQFAQTRYVQQKGKELGLGPPDSPWEGGCLYYAKRSTEIFRIWEQEFGGTNRIVRVLAWQAASSWWQDRLLSNVPKGSFDALAVAPYMGMGISASSDKPDALTADKVAGWTTSELLDYFEKNSLPEATDNMNKAAAVARKHGVSLLAYEGGQHLVGIRGGENNDALTKLLHQANADPRMGRYYADYLGAWERAGGNLFCHFSSVSTWSKWGSWGLLQFQDEDASKSPKYMAVMKWGKSLGQNVSLPSE